MTEALENGVFHSDVDLIFKSYLDKEIEPRIMVENTNEGKVVKKMNYDKVVFGHDMTIYKLEKDLSDLLNEGVISKVEKPEFRSVVVERKM